jgi:TPR repeat protein
MTGTAGIVSRAIFAAFLLCAGLAPAAHAEKRVALVIGNSAYQAVPKLPNPDNDAKLMSDTLLSLGFFVVGGAARLDLDKSGFDAALEEFSRQLVGADVALFYYAGHGVETHGLNYLVPVDAHPQDEADVFAQMVSTSDILDRLEKSSTRINLVLLDACRDNPFRGVRSTARGLAQMPAPIGTLISFATQPRSVSLDGEGGHSPYTSALVAAMQRPGAGLFKTFNEVGLAVGKATGGQQLPWVSSSPISGNFYFAGKPEPAVAMQKAGPAPGASDAPVQPAPVQEARFSPPDDPLRQNVVNDCDRLAAMPFDTGHPPDIRGVEVDRIKVAAAAPACNEAMQRYPDVIRFVFEAGRVASARKDYAEARRLYDQAAAAGYAMAMNNIGALYEGGSGTPVNYVEAAQWYQKAVDAGEPIAMIDLGYQYEHGHGVKRDYAKARELYETALKAGMPSAMNNLGLMYMYGEGMPRDYAEARRLFEQGIALGDASCMNGLGVLYNTGEGVPRDGRVARQWFQKAAALGNPEAKQNLK